MLHMSLRSVILFILLIPFGVRSQELDCQVEINTDRIGVSNRSLFDALRQSVNDYLNTTRFTDTRFAVFEKIQCRFFLTVESMEGNLIKGNLQVQSSRPVYNSSYVTTLLNLKDNDIEFEYSENDPLTFSETTMESNLTAILNFYAYLILALDFDSFSLRGGDQCFSRLQSVVSIAQSSGHGGWRDFDNRRNRAAILEAFTGASTSPLRDLTYGYHRLGLDQMSVSPEKGRKALLESLDYLTRVHQSAPMSVGLAIFHDAKLDEIVNVCSQATADERKRTFNILSPLYPADIQLLNGIGGTQTP